MGTATAGAFTVGSRRIWRHGRDAVDAPSRDPVERAQDTCLATAVRHRRGLDGSGCWCQTLTDAPARRQRGPCGHRRRRGGVAAVRRTDTASHPVNVTPGSRRRSAVTTISVKSPRRWRRHQRSRASATGARESGRPTVTRPAPKPARTREPSRRRSRGVPTQDHGERGRER